jgi:hemerythrin-like domain-containing protein
MGKTEMLGSIAETHKEISEQKAIVNGFLKEFNKKGTQFDVKCIIEFFDSTLASHFLKENLIFSELLRIGELDAKKAEVVSGSILEHADFLDEFILLGRIAGRIESGEDDLELDFIKKCQYIIWALSKHAQVEDIIIFPEVEEKLKITSFQMIENEFLKNQA